MNEFKELGYKIMGKGAEVTGYAAGRVLSLGIDAYVEVKFWQEAKAMISSSGKTAVKAFAEHYHDLRELDLTRKESLQYAYQRAERVFIYSMAKKD